MNHSVLNIYPTPGMNIYHEDVNSISLLERMAELDKVLRHVSSEELEAYLSWREDVDSKKTPTTSPYTTSSAVQMQPECPPCDCGPGAKGWGHDFRDQVTGFVHETATDVGNQAATAASTMYENFQHMCDKAEAEKPQTTMATATSTVSGWMSKAATTVGMAKKPEEGWELKPQFCEINTSWDGVGILQGRAYN